MIEKRTSVKLVYDETDLASVEAFAVDRRPDDVLYLSVNGDEGEEHDLGDFLEFCKKVLEVFG